MGALLLKDWYLIRKKYTWIFLLALTVSAIPLLSETLARNGFFLVYPCCVGFNLSFYLMQADRGSRWDVYACALPYSRAMQISEKYLIGLIAGAVSVAWVLVMQGWTLHRFGGFQWEAIGAMAYFLFFGGCLLLSLYMPLMCLFGVSTGQYVFGFLLVVLLVLFLLLFLLLSFALPYEMFSETMFKLFLPTPAVLGLSWYLSIRFYGRLDLGA